MEASGGIGREGWRTLNGGQWREINAPRRWKDPLSQAEDTGDRHFKKDEGTNECSGSAGDQQRAEGTTEPSNGHRRLTLPEGLKEPLSAVGAQEINNPRRWKKPLSPVMDMVGGTTECSGAQEINTPHILGGTTECSGGTG
ncbi:unnamed protein product, partial [Staurois parvus]